MASQTPGWYPDPNDSAFEVYWDGDSWHGRREKLQSSNAAPPTTGGPALGSTLTAILNVATAIPCATGFDHRRGSGAHRDCGSGDTRCFGGPERESLQDRDD